jgi:prepilin-type N-terminal cleavage/methylation domain-containing protein
MKRRHTSTKGFTIIETLIAISILTMVIAAVGSVIHSSLRASLHARDQVVATFLAQEALETVRHARDINITTGSDWLEGIEGACAASACRVSAFASPPISSCAGGACPVLGYDDVTGRYGYDPSWPASRFIREVELDIGSGEGSYQIIYADPTRCWRRTTRHWPN